MKQWCKDNPDKCHEAMQQKAKAWWKKVDTDGDGSISRAEAQAQRAAAGRRLRQGGYE